MDAGRHDSRSPCGLFSLLLAATGMPSAVFRRRDSAPFFQALSAWGESRVSCLASRSYGVPGHGSVIPALPHEHRSKPTAAAGSDPRGRVLTPSSPNVMSSALIRAGTYVGSSARRAAIKQMKTGLALLKARPSACTLY
ncbi:hypothetical protein NDU88_003087 [Pleurodeles waltl]|uniref:Secreted protein n=1 Tax=Pleurodeles waltl TaxID=8319 RepID=A0AAV7KTX0_PLEWA|nr:hypothetical protein NDU88_003087 [Pleurodeles waltl]